MADPQTSNILLSVPLRGSDVGTWDVPVNGDFTAIDGYFGGIQTVAVSNAPITLSAPSGVVTPAPGPTQAQNAVLKITGTLSSDVVITLPLPGYYVVDNSAVPVAFTVIFRALASGEVIGMPYGSVKHIYNDGTNVRFVNLQEVGSYMDYAGTGVPLWIPLARSRHFSIATEVHLAMSPIRCWQQSWAALHCLICVACLVTRSIRGRAG